MAVCCLGLFITSCEKEEQNITPNETKNESLSYSPERSIMNSAHKAFFQMDEEVFKSKAGIILADLKNDKRISTNDKSGEENNPIPLEEVFYLYEGVINSLYSTQITEGLDIEIVEVPYTIPIYNEEGDNLINIEDFNDFFSSIDTYIGGINAVEGQSILVVNLDLSSIGTSSAVVTASYSIGAVNNILQVPFPSGEVRGALRAGWCLDPTPIVDAADFARDYVNRNSLTQANNYGCPVNYYIVVPASLSNNNSQAYFDNIQLPVNVIRDIKPLTWERVNNDCIGDESDSQQNNVDWTNFYNRVDRLYKVVLLNALKAQYAQLFGQGQYQNVQFLVTDYKSYPKIGPNLNWSSTNAYYHAGTAQYGVIVCY